MNIRPMLDQHFDCSHVTFCYGAVQRGPVIAAARRIQGSARCCQPGHFLPVAPLSSGKQALAGSLRLQLQQIHHLLRT